MRSFVTRRFALMAVAIFCGAAHAQDHTLARIVRIDIAAQPLAPALLEFSRQAQVQIITLAPVVEPYATRGARGRMPLGEALTEILAGSSLSFHVVGVNTIGIEATQGSASTPSASRPFPAEAPAPPADATEPSSTTDIWTQVVQGFEQLSPFAAETP